MKLTLALILLGLVACSHQQPEATSPRAATTDSDSSEPQVDPTLPSWAPRSCKAYHTAVVEAMGCSGLAQSSRDSIKEKYEASNTSWHDMHDAPQGAIEKIRVSCTEDAKSVRAESDGKCLAEK